jgi:hypothetical protein
MIDHLTAYGWILENAIQSLAEKKWFDTSFLEREETDFYFKTDRGTTYKRGQSGKLRASGRHTIQEAC